MGIPTAAGGERSGGCCSTEWTWHAVDAQGAESIVSQVIWVRVSKSVRNIPNLSGRSSEKMEKGRRDTAKFLCVVLHLGKKT